MNDFTRNIIFEKDDEQSQLKHFIELKGYMLHRHVYEYLEILLKREQITYSELSSVIRYDKRLRDKLYVYLSTAEEYLKAYIFDNYYLNDKDTIMKKDGFNVRSDISKILEKVTRRETNTINLYFDLKTTLGGIKYIFENLDIKIDGKNIIDDLQRVNNLRNKVMHHNMLLLPDSVSVESLDKNLEELKGELIALKNILPESRRKSYVETVNHMKKFSKYIKVGDI